MIEAFVYHQNKLCKSRPLETRSTSGSHLKDSRNFKVSSLSSKLLSPDIRTHKHHSVFCQPQNGLGQQTEPPTQHFKSGVMVTSFPSLTSHSRARTVPSVSQLSSQISKRKLLQTKSPIMSTLDYRRARLILFGLHAAAIILRCLAVSGLLSLGKVPHFLRDSSRLK